MSKLTGKVAVVTGASKGIGASIAEHLAAEGASVVVNYASCKSGAEKLVRRITEKGGKAIAIQADVSKPRTSSASSRRPKLPMEDWTLWSTTPGCTSSCLWRR